MKKAGFYTFTCCEGCQFAMLFIDNILDLLDQFEIPHFNLLKEKNYDCDLDIAFVEGAISTASEKEELESVRKRSRQVVALGTCACKGGIPAMANFVGSGDTSKYTYRRHDRNEHIHVAGIDAFIPVDYYLPGCPVIGSELEAFLKGYGEGKLPEPYEGAVCTQCPRRGKECFMGQKKPCMGSITHGGCGGLCTGNGIPCALCRGPVPGANFAKEIKMFEKFGLSEHEIHDRLNMFENIEEEQA